MTPKERRHKQLMEELEALIGLGMLILGLVFVALVICLLLHVGGTQWIGSAGKFFPKTIYVRAGL